MTAPLPFAPAETRLVRVADFAHLRPHAPVATSVEGRQIVLVRDGLRVHALDGACTHAGGPLDEGVVRGCVLSCPWHEAAFDLATGQPLSGPARKPLRTYPVTVDDGGVWVTVPTQP